MALREQQVPNRAREEAPVTRREVMADTDGIASHSAFACECGNTAALRGALPDRDRPPMHARCNRAFELCFCAGRPHR